MDTNNGDEPVIDWQQEAVFYQTALETALGYQVTLEKTISQFQQTIKKQTTQIDQLKETTKKQHTQIRTLKEKITPKDTSIQTGIRMYDHLEARLKELEADHLAQARRLIEQTHTLQTQQQTIKLLQKALHQQREDSSQS